MAQRLSRRKIAAHYASEMLAGKKDVARKLAAYLVDTRRVRELDLIIRDIESALTDRGTLLADVTSARKLSSEATKEITKYLKSTTNADHVHLRESVDETVLGGVRIAVPGRELDATLRHRLNQLKATKI